MKIFLIQIGKTSDKNLLNLIQDYFERINHYCNFEIISLPALKNTQNFSHKQFMDKEADIFLNYLKDKKNVILLDETAKEFTSIEFANFIENKMNHCSELYFVIGGAYGFADIMRKKNYNLISLSKLTFSHQLVRVIFLEQLYRCFTIIKKQPYHNP